MWPPNEAGKPGNEASYMGGTTGSQAAFRAVLVYHVRSTRVLTLICHVFVVILVVVAIPPTFLPWGEHCMHHTPKGASLIPRPTPCTLKQF